MPSDEHKHNAAGLIKSATALVATEPPTNGIWLPVHFQFGHDQTIMRISPFLTAVSTIRRRIAIDMLSFLRSKYATPGDASAFKP